MIAPGVIPEIRVLPALVANQIAAGEVVERPASVVKELVDNALDAGATRISVEIDQGGIELVRVTDDGHGVPPEQLALMVAPHATSKVRTADDLDRITTMGFRGEALASIASVSRLSIRSRTAAEASASRLDVEGVTHAPVRPDSGGIGTSITVRNLFFNTPARRKFLRTPATEHGHCEVAVRDLAMAHPHVGFVFRADGRTVLDVPPGQGPRKRALALLGEELESQFVEVGADGFDDARGLALWGLAGLPALARPTPRAQHVFVNGRPIRDRTVQHALKEAFRGLIEPTKHPAAVIQIVMDPGAVDVNVHPAKAEVRFRDSGLVHQVVYRAVREGLRGADLTPDVGAGGGEGAAGGRGLPSAPALPLTPIVPARVAGSLASSFTDSFLRPAPAASQARLIDRAWGGSASFGSTERGLGIAANTASPGVANGPDPIISATEEAPAPAVPLSAPVPVERVLQVHNSYLITQDDQGLVIIDQHALHERVMYERLMARVTTGPLESQSLLVPLIIGASPGGVEAAQARRDLLASVGLALEPAGPASVSVQAFPSFLLEKGVDAGGFVSELLERLASEPVEAKEGGESRREDMLHEVLDMMACKAAIKAGDAMSEPELLELLRLREAVDRSSNCPHGRPTALRVTIKDLERSFGRS